MAACAPYLDRQETALDPVLVVTLGRHSLQRYLPGARISEVHGHLRRSGGRFVLPMYHPAAALRSSGLRETLAEDMRGLPAALLAAREALAAEREEPGAAPEGEVTSPTPTVEDDDQQMTLF